MSDDPRRNGHPEPPPETVEHDGHTYQLAGILRWSKWPVYHSRATGLQLIRLPDGMLAVVDEVEVKAIEIEAKVARQAANPDRRAKKASGLSPRQFRKFRREQRGTDD